MNPAHEPFLIDRLLEAPCLELLRPRPGLRILDVGCGPGALAAALATRGADVVAFDPDPTALARARTRPEPVDWREGCVESPPLDDAEGGHFDLVLARFVLESLPDPLAATRHMVRMARPGGRIALIDDDHASLQLTPEVPDFDAIWASYCRVFDRTGDATIGRRLGSLLREAGAELQIERRFSIRGVHGDADLAPLVDRLIAVIESRGARLLDDGIDAEMGRTVLTDLRRFATQPQARLQYHVNAVVGRRPSAG